MRKPVATILTISLGTLASFCWAPPALGDALDFGPQQIIQDGFSDLDVGTNSGTCYADGDNDGRKDLIVGQGAGRVRLYPNAGSGSAPAFLGNSYVQAGGSDLVVGASGCLGSFPRLVDWNNDDKKDLVVGDGLGRVNLFLNTNTDDDPVFGSGTYVQVGPAGSKTAIDIGSRATSSVVDWDSDGMKDLVVGEITDGVINLFLNEGTDASPDFISGSLVQDSGTGLALMVPSSRSSPDIADLDGDGKKDLLTGNTNGQLLFYSNTGTDAEPLFSLYDSATSEGAPILLGSRTRPFVCDWTGDDLQDVLVGDLSGRVYLYQGVPEPASLVLLATAGLGALLGVLLRRRRRAAY